MSRASKRRRPGRGRSSAHRAARGPFPNTLSRAWHAPLWAHVAVLVAVVLALAPFMYLDGSTWVDDEGAYGLQVESLHDGRWDYDYAGASFDPEGRWFPIQRVTEGDGKYYPYVDHPGYILALYGTTKAVGTGIGIYALPVLGLVATACAAWLLASEFREGNRRVAFWLVAVSPLILNAFVLWAHTMSAALAGISLVAATRMVKTGPRLGAMVVLTFALATGVLFRSEGALFAVALLACAGGFIIRERRVLHALTVVVLGALATIGAAFVEVWSIGRIIGEANGLRGSRSSSGLSSPLEFIEGRIGGVWRIVLDGSESLTKPAVLVGIALGLVTVAGLAMRGRSQEARLLGSGLAVICLGAAFFLYAARFEDAPEDTASGMFAAWPVALAGLVMVAWRTLTKAEWLAVATIAVFAGGVFATQYEVGGGGEWGGRFLSPAVVPLAALAALGFQRGLWDRPWRQRWTVGALVVLLAVFVPASGFRGLRMSRGFETTLHEQFARVATPVVVVSDSRLWRWPKEAWRWRDDFTWFVDYRGDTAELLAHLYEQGVESVTLVPQSGAEARQSPFKTVREVTPAVFRENGAAVFVLSRTAASS